MTEEEKKAIERANEILKEWQKIVDIEDDIERDIEMSMYSEEMPFYTMKTLLNLIQKQDTEINKLKETIQKQENSREHLKKQFKGEINKLNNVIDKTTKYIEEIIGSCPYDTFDCQVRDCEKECKDQMAECWKEYFMKNNGEVHK